MEYRKDNNNSHSNGNGYHGGNNNNSHGNGGYRGGNNNNHGNGNNYHGGNRNGGFNSNNGWQSNNADKYVGNPYNFVPFYDEVVSVEKEEMGVLDRIGDKLLSGEISYSFEAMTPIFSDDGTDKHDFYHDAKNRYALPGSTMRGLIRSNVQILGLAGFNDDIDDYDLMYRNVAAGAEKKAYNDILGSKQILIGNGKSTVGVLTNVAAGYIVKKGSKYFIYKTVVDKLQNNLNAMNYYVLSERKVAEDAQKGWNNYPYFKDHKECLQNDVARGFDNIKKNGRIHYVGTKNNGYVPGYYNVSYEVTNIKNVSAVGETGVYTNDGVLVGTGFMKEKKAQYIVPQIDMSKEPIEISDEDIRAFEIDYEHKKNTLKSKEFFNLPTEDEQKPVFYIQLGGRLYFGFTPRLRLFYANSIKDGLHQDTPTFDFAKSIFGTIGEKGSYRSKVSFSDAVAYDKVTRGKDGKIILGEPKATSYLDYLAQNNKNGNAVTYNTNNFRLAGVKQYWLRKNIWTPQSNVQNDKVYSTIRPLEKGTIFNGKIRFTNLTKTELGLLVWSVRLNENSWMNVGKAKAYGYGAIALKNMEVQVLDVAKEYGLFDSLSVSPYEIRQASELIDGYKAFINTKLGSAKIDDLPHIKTFFLMKDSKKMPKEEKIRYMSIDAREYQNRTKPLQRPEDVCNN